MLKCRSESDIVFISFAFWKFIVKSFCLVLFIVIFSLCLDVMMTTLNLILKLGQWEYISGLNLIWFCCFFLIRILDGIVKDFIQFESECFHIFDSHTVFPSKSLTSLWFDSLQRSSLPSFHFHHFIPISSSHLSRFYLNWIILISHFFAPNNFLFHCSLHFLNFSIFYQFISLFFFFFYQLIYLFFSSVNIFLFLISRSFSF